MKIVLTGGGTGGHFYPLMAVAEEILKETYSKKLLQPKMYYFASSPYDANMLYERGITYTNIPAGKIRVYGSFQNIIDLFKIIFGSFVAFFKLLLLYPDVVFAKGGYDSLPTCIAAFLLRIPIVTHESDSIPGRTSKIVSKLASRVGLSYKEAAKYFNNKNLAVTGQPVIEKYLPKENFKREYKVNSVTNRQTILISGGSQGSTRINDVVLEILPKLVGNYKVIHQVGDANLADIQSRVGVILEHYSTDNYEMKGSLDFAEVYPICDIAVTRAGSSLFELAVWQIPTIAIPLPEAHAGHQKENAFIQQDKGWVKVLLEDNLSPNILLAAIESILQNKETYQHMVESSENVTTKDSAKIIADEILEIALSHA